jgi:DNA-binding response OmpR family regulator
MHGFSVDAYDNPQTALENFEPSAYDQIILDIRMPGMNGFDLARQLWVKDPKAQICFLSAFEIFPDEADKVFKDFNTRCFVKKPITASDLLQHIKIHLARA